MDRARKLMVYELLWALPLLSLRGYCCFPGLVAQARLEGAAATAVVTALYALLGSLHPVLGGLVSFLAGWSYTYGCCALPGLLESQMPVLFSSLCKARSTRSFAAALLAVGSAAGLVELVACGGCFPA